MNKWIRGLHSPAQIQKSLVVLARSRNSRSPCCDSVPRNGGRVSFRIPCAFPRRGGSLALFWYLKVRTWSISQRGSRLLLHYGLYYEGSLRKTSSAALYADATPAFSLRFTNARTLLKKDSISRVQSPRNPPSYFTRHFCFPRRKPFLGIHRPCINRSSEHRRGEIAQRRRRSWERRRNGGDRRAMKMMLEGRGRGTGDGGRRGEKKSVSKIGATRCIHRGTFPWPRNREF